MSKPIGPGSEPADLVERILAFPGENRFVEFKRVGDNDKKLKTIVAFANTAGGVLVLGVDDPKKATGRDRLYGIEENPESVDELRRHVTQRITPTIGSAETPAPVFESVPCTLRDGRPGSILLVRVARSSDVHSIVNGGTYLKLEHSVRQLTAAEIAELSMQRGATSWVNGTADFDFSLLETEWWDDYARRRRLDAKRSIAQNLERLGLAKKDGEGVLRPLRAAALLFADHPGGLLQTKCAIRLFHYKGDRIEHTVHTNLLRPPKTIDGTAIEQIRRARDAVVDELAAGVHVGPLGFQIVQKYPVRVITEAITNAVLHRDYRLEADIHIRIFSNRIEFESPGLLPRNVTPANITTVGSRPRNRLLVDHVREFSDPPNLDAGEGVPMMVAAMNHERLYPPSFLTPPDWHREAVVCVCFNEAQPSAWAQVDAFLAAHGHIGNAEVREILGADTLTASKTLRSWVELGLLVVVDPSAAKQHRRYRRPGAAEAPSLLSSLLGKHQP